MPCTAIEWKGLSMTNTAKTLVIIAHPDLQNQSRVHRRWKEELDLYTDEFDVRDLYALYPNNVFSDEDIAKEQEALAAHDLIVFQFPIYWYHAPALLQNWFDNVYAFGWAYGGERANPGEPGRMLADKHFAVAVSAGDIKQNYQATGTVGFTPSEIIIPFRATANYVGATCEEEPFILFGTENNGLSDERLEESASAYITWLRTLRNNLSGQRIE